MLKVLRFRTARWVATVPETLPVNMEDLRVRELALEVQNRLRTGKANIISRAEYYRIGGEVGMTRKTSQELLDNLELSGGVFIDQDTVYLAPLRLFNEVNKQYGLPPFDPCPALTAKLEELQKEFEIIAAKKALADSDVAKKRLRIWSVVSCLSGLQMCGFAFLTFPSLSGDYCLGWDVIEPISFFIMQAYVVSWFAYFFYTKREHSLMAWDERQFYKMSKRAYEKRSVDIVRWAELKTEIKKLDLKRREFHIPLE
eukprot:TRINITY_DN3489_c0_g1_i5.p1 TRINITY_DN3489_c0_g1~~TRINITY_DN3489_c0_g1_i5.p1  ORF type:complete len:297 (+),score=71.71 TRINITY_DN3489_c0_g1_i5:125-892(+)